MTLINLYTVVGTGLQWDGTTYATGGSAGALGAAADSAIYNWQPVDYPAGGLGETAISANDSISAGVSAVITLINANAGPFALVGESQGALVISKVLQELQSGSLTSRMGDLVAAVTFGNPMRQAGHTFPRDPGRALATGQGVNAIRLTDTPELWWDMCTPNDIAATSIIGGAGTLAAECFSVACQVAWQINDSGVFYKGLAGALANAADLVSQLIVSLLSNPFASGSALDQAIVWAYQCVANITTSGHQAYNTYQVTPGVTYIDLAIQYLNGTLAPAGPGGTVFYLEGTSVSATTDPATQDAIMAGAFDSSFGSANGYTGVWINYPASLAPLVGSATFGDSVAAGVAALDAAIKATDGPKVLVGISQGAVVIDCELANLINDPDAPPANELKAFCVADPLRPGGLIHRFFSPGQTIPIVDFEMIAVPNSQYDVTVLVQQYDGMADYPDNEPSPMHVLTSQHPIAIANALLGFALLHVGLSSLVGSPAGYQSPYPPAGSPFNTTTCSNGGTIETFLLPTDPLPLVVPLPGFAWTIATLIIRPLVEAAYNRGARDYTTS